ncbi:dynamin family protein, partial [Chamaesiphon sp. VAR_48_metabat_135_sub]|uniref:dynamin family protein n=1 Tax=Chamaesiphon sp. VAR_48_metabat_135_sub TaxID=2964699 RepID=UPI00286D57E1
MMSTAQTNRFLQDLDRVARVRQEVAGCLRRMITNLQKSELAAQKGSGEMGFDRDLADLTKASTNLQQGVFRLMVLGDMKRGKSTFLNALIGENILPSDVNPCTALLTVLRYGEEKKVTVHFKDGKPAESIDFSAFKTKYTIDPAEAKKLEESNQPAFPDVDYAVVEYPLELLSKGIEIIDSPGLNDTEARNELSLGYLNNCHAVLFVLSASQPCTLGERRYLENYVKDRGLSVFFLINAWDRVKESLIDPDDATEMAEAEGKLNRVFKANLAEYCAVDGYDIYDERVFSLSSITALRRRIKDKDADLEGTGFPPFINALNTFLTQERAIAELRQARIIGKQTCTHVKEAVARRIPLLDADVNELKTKIAAVEPQFNKLQEIRDLFRDDIRRVRDRQARSIADSMKTYLLQLEDTFEADFQTYQPSDLQLLDFFSGSKREQFNQAAQKGFQQYINDKYATWTLSAQKELTAAFSELSVQAQKHGGDYQNITQEMAEKLTGKIHTRSKALDDDGTPAWAKWAMGLFSLASGNFAVAALAVGGFNFQSIMLNIFTTAGIAVVFGALLGPIGVMAAGIGVAAFQVEHARKYFTQEIKKQLIAKLPEISKEQWQPIYSAVQECFDSYEREAIERIDDDIKTRKGELQNLVKQKESQEIDRVTEVDRLQKFEADVVKESESIES